LSPRSAVTPIALVVLAAGAAAYAYLVDRRSVSDAERAARRSDAFPSFRVEDVRRLELAQGAESLVLERNEGATATWTMTSPRRDRADATAVDVLLRELEMATRVRDVQSGDALGLDTPRVRGRVTIGSLDYRFALGGNAPTPEGAAYMRVDGEGTFVVGRSLTVQLLRGPDAYRDRALVPWTASEVARMKVTAPSGGFALERSGVTFRVGGTAGLRASRAAVDRLFASLADARAESFLDDAEADRAMGESALVVTLGSRDPNQPRVRLVVGGACPGQGQDVVAIRSEPTRVSACVARGVLDALGQDAKALVDDSPLFAHGDEIEQLRLEPLASDGPRVDVARYGTGWHERAPEDRDLDPDESDSANALAVTLATARAVDVRAPDPGDPFDARSRVTIVRTGGGTTEVVEVAAPDTGGVAVARRLDDGAILRLARAVARRFEAHPIALRARTVRQAPFDPASVVAFDDSCGPTPQRLELRGGVWTMRAPAGLAADAASAVDLVDAIARAKADSWVAERDDGGFGLQRAGSCQIKLTVSSIEDAGPDRSWGILFGDEGEGGTYARALDGQAVFVAPSILREIAARPVIDRSRTRLDPGALTRLTLARGGARLAFRREEGGGGSRLVRDAAGNDAGPEDKLEVALGRLYAQYAVHAGPPWSQEGMDRPTLEIDATARADAGSLPLETRITIGQARPTREFTGGAYFARVAGVDATFVVPKQAVDAILDAW
jgi:hypothetical protein